MKPYKDGNQWCILAGNNIQEGICGFGDTIDEALYQFLKEVLDLQKKQKPVEWSEEDITQKALRLEYEKGRAGVINKLLSDEELAKMTNEICEEIKNTINTTFLGILAKEE